MNEVTITQPVNTTRIMIPLDIPTPLLQAGAIELYAMKKCKWTPTIKDADGNDIPNPLSALDSAATRIRQTIKDEYKLLILNDSAQKAKTQAEAQFDSLFQ